MNFDHYAACAESAPDGLYLQTKIVRALIGDAVDRLIRDARALGLRADNCDGAHALEVAIYEWLRAANPENYEFDTAEGFGAALDTEARDRVLASARAAVAHYRDRDGYAPTAGGAA